jgi:membrane-bound lytic murein transglycosylase F
MRPYFRLRVIGTLLMLCATVIISGCQIDSKPKSELNEIRKRGVLRVGTLNNQLSYFIGPEGPSGLDYELAREFANQLGVKLEMKPIYRASSLFPALERGEIDMIAAGQSQTKARIDKFRSGPAYYYVSQQVVYRQGTPKPRNLKQIVEEQTDVTAPADIAKMFAVIEDDHFKVTLDTLKKKYPTFKFAVDPNSDSNDLLKKVSEGELEFTIANSVDVSLAQRIYPDLATAFELTEDQSVSWFMRRSDDESLYALMIEFFGDLKQSGTLASLEEKYFGHVGNFDYVDTRAFIRALDSRLPNWEPLFQKYSSDLDWRLIAALAYQESHWNSNAKSPTGVRGLMMLTQSTARSLGISNRLDPEQSIKGGVRYLNRMLNRIPDAITDHEKVWFALASYNLGYGHVMDARRLTKSQGKDPNSWSDVKERLPQLREKKYFSQTRYGYARGDEALNYVENIRRYYQSIIGHVDQQRATDNTLDLNGIAVIPAPPDSIAANPKSEIDQEGPLPDSINVEDGPLPDSINTLEAPPEIGLQDSFYADDLPTENKNSGSDN